MTAEDIERKLDAGEWLRPGEAAELLGTSRTTVHRWLTDGRVRYRQRPLSTRRELHPEDVRRLLDEYRREHGGTGGEG